ncbi:MAG: hypothetical protein QW100_03610 [Thermoplasmatales archaeon]
MQIFLIYIKNRDPSHFDNLLREVNIEVEWYRKEHAMHTAEFGYEAGDFSSNFRDYMIASHAYLPPWIVVTNNTKDFAFLRERVRTPQDFENEYML